ncbi:MAG: outer membrane beta-barrel protein [Bacteroidota bacterium]
MIGYTQSALYSNKASMGNQAGILIGGMMNIPLFDCFEVQPEIAYLTKGGEDISPSLTIPGFTDISAYYSKHYVQMPIIARGRIPVGQSLAFTGLLGLYGAFIVGSDDFLEMRSYNDDGTIKEHRLVNQTFDTDSFDTGVITGIGMDLMIGTRTIQSELRIATGFRNVYRVIGPFGNRTVSITAGYLF